MSQENVEVVRQMWECFLGENPVSGLAFCDPDVEWDGTNLPDGELARGHEAVVEHAMRWAEMWDDWRIEPERFIDAGDDQVILVFRETGRSDSGLRMDERHAEGFSDPGEALEAVPLSE
jgi:ketosteroid isomerase-like protein